MEQLTERHSTNPQGQRPMGGYQYGPDTRATGVFPQNTAVELWLPGFAQSVSAARHWAGEVLARWHLDLLDAEDTVELVVSELVTNAVTQIYLSGAKVKVTLGRAGPARVCIDVWDPTPGRPVVSGGLEDTFEESGRGLILVGALAELWGTTTEAVGKSVWAVVDLSPAS